VKRRLTCTCHFSRTIATRSLTCLHCCSDYASRAPLGSRQTRILQNVADTHAPLPVLYGRQKVGTRIVDMRTVGADNTYRWIVGALAVSPARPETLADRLIRAGCPRFGGYALSLTCASRCSDLRAKTVSRETEHLTVGASGLASYIQGPMAPTSTHPVLAAILIS
jgi:hypothetical protein